MKKFTLLLFTALLINLCTAAAVLTNKTIAVGDDEREYAIYFPESTEKPPLVFVFHGHGGNIRNSARTFAIHELWPEACVVYMQGLKTPGKLTDPEGKRTGWQHSKGAQNDRDLKFFDAVYGSLADRINVNNVFSTGHSNGGGFTYLLWYTRGDKFRAFAPSSAAASSFIRDMRRKGIAKPLIHYAAKNDPLVKFQWQWATLMRIHSINDCQKQAEPWHSEGIITGRIYASKSANPIVTLLSDGDHKFPKEAAKLFVRFFKEQLIDQSQTNLENEKVTN